MDTFQEFKKLHEQPTPLFIGNVWDVSSAILFEQKGYKCLGTSSAAIASSLGYDDGEQMNFEELLAIVKAIKAKTTLPLTVDLEAGYSRDSGEISQNIIRLHKLGVIGINLEDSIVTNGDRKIVDSDDFSDTIISIKNKLQEKGIEVFLNIRTDFFIMGLDNPLKETIKRVMLYEQAGADGVFIPCVTTENNIKAIIESVSIPVNVMTMPDLPTFERLQQLGVKRVSAGPFLYNKMSENLGELLDAIDEHQSFSPLFK